MISGLDIEEYSLDAVAQRLIEMGSKTVIITLGKDGSFLYSEGTARRLIATRLKLATSVSAVAVTQLGAQSSIPTKAEVESFMLSQVK